jgi:hypothetical protein
MRDSEDEEDLENYSEQVSMLATEESPHIVIKTCSTLRPKLINYTTSG